MTHTPIVTQTIQQAGFTAKALGGGVLVSLNRPLAINEVWHVINQEMPELIDTFSFEKWGDRVFVSWEE